jgi:hypothetical protein
MPFRHSKFRERIRNPVDLHVAAMRDVDGPAERVRYFTKHPRHLFRGLEIKLVRLKLHAVRVAHGLAGLNTEQHFLSVRVVMVQIVAIVRGDQRNPGFLGQPHDFRIHALVDFQVLILNLQEEIVLTKDVAQAVGVLARQIVLLFNNRLGHRAAQASRQCDEAFAVLGQQVIVDSGFVVEAFEKTRRNQLDQIVITLQRFAQQHEVIAAASAGRLRLAAILAVAAAIYFLAALVPAAPRNVDFAPDDRFYVALACFVVEVRGGKQIAVVGDGHRRHFLPRRLVKKLRGFASTVEQAVIGMNVKMNELRLTHGTRL